MMLSRILLMNHYENTLWRDTKCGALHLTADKREIKDSPKLLLATSFIRKTLSETANRLGRASVPAKCWTKI